MPLQFSRFCLSSMSGKSGELVLKEVKEERAGVFCSLKAVCDQCGYEGCVDQPSRGKTSFREGSTLNTSLCLGAAAVGLDYNSVQRLCQVMGL